MRDDRKPSTPTPTTTSRRTFLAGAVGTAALGATATASASDHHRKRETSKRIDDGELTSHDLTMDDGYRLRV